MNIAVVSNVVYPFVKGGAEKRIHEIGSRLVDAGHEVTIYGRHFWDGPDEIEYEGMTLRAVSPARELYVGDRRSISEAIEFSTFLLRPLRRHVHEHDVVIASVFPYFPVLAITSVSDIPLITTWHEVWGSYWEEYLGWLAPFGRVIERITANVPQYPIAVSGATADRLARIGPSRESIRVIPNGIDLDQIRSIQPTVEGFDVLFAGRLLEHKNVDLLLRAFDRIADKYDASLGIIGDGPELGRLQAHVEQLNATDRIVFLGFLNEYEDVLAHMRAANVFVSPSTREGFGIAVAEAMAADCTVIAVDHPNSAASEIVVDGGFLVEPSLSSLASTLDRALEGTRPAEDPISVAERYDWDTVAEQAEKAYRTVIQDHRTTLYQ